jgi:hypothetical protein
MKVITDKSLFFYQIIIYFSLLFWVISCEDLLFNLLIEIAYTSMQIISI